MKHIHRSLSIPHNDNPKSYTIVVIHADGSIRRISTTCRGFHEFNDSWLERAALFCSQMETKRTQYAIALIK